MRRGLAIKRAFDLVACAVMALPALGITAVLMVIVRVFDGPDTIFSQQRVGRDQELFTIYKVRTLPAGTPEAATHLIAPPSTQVAQLLRRHRLDEIPQLWNVIRGDMSLVGPRPCLTNQHELIAEREARGLFDIPPGVTGRAQILGIDMSDPARLASIESVYLDEMGVLTDVRYLLRTIKGSIQEDQAARPSSDG